MDINRSSRSGGERPQTDRQISCYFVVLITHFDRKRKLDTLNESISGVEKKLKCSESELKKASVGREETEENKNLDLQHSFVQSTFRHAFLFWLSVNHLE